MAVPARAQMVVAAVVAAAVGAAAGVVEAVAGVVGAAVVVEAAVVATAALEDSRNMAAASGVECYPRPPLDVPELEQLPKQCQRRRSQSLRDGE